MTLWRAAASLAAPQRVDEKLPVRILTPSRAIRRFASLAAAVGFGMSAIAKVSFFPMTPPRALMRSRMISYPARWRLPSEESGPVSGSRTPILYSPLSWAWAVATGRAASRVRTATATTGIRRCMGDLLGCGRGLRRRCVVRLVHRGAGRVKAPGCVTGARLRYTRSVSDEHPHRVLAPSTIRFCPLCGAALAAEAVPPDQREQQVCTRCRFVFYLNPKVVAATLPERDGTVLLTRRSINPGRGLWTFPGGFVDFGETVTDAAVRKTLEETGLEVVLTGLHNVYTYPGAPVIIVYTARVRGGTLTPCAENDALEWVAPARIPWDRLAFPSTREALREWVAARGGMPAG